jgi:hypothetical protein
MNPVARRSDATLPSHGIVRDAESLGLVAFSAPAEPVPTAPAEPAATASASVAGTPHAASLAEARGAERASRAITLSVGPAEPHEPVRWRGGASNSVSLRPSTVSSALGDDDEEDEEEEEEEDDEARLLLGSDDADADAALALSTAEPL